MSKYAVIEGMEWNWQIHKNIGDWSANLEAALDKGKAKFFPEGRPKVVDPEITLTPVALFHEGDVSDGLLVEDRRRQMA